MLAVSTEHSVLRVIMCSFNSHVNFITSCLPPTKEEVYVFAPWPVLVCLSVCQCARLLKNACMDLDEMLRVDRCLDFDELINF